MGKSKIAYYGSLTMMICGVILIIIDVVREEDRVPIGSLLSHLSLIACGILFLNLNKKKNNAE